MASPSDTNSNEIIRTHLWLLILLHYVTKRQSPPAPLRTWVKKGKSSFTEFFFLWWDGLQTTRLLYTTKISCLLYKCSYILCAAYGLVYAWPTFTEEMNM